VVQQKLPQQQFQQPAASRSGRQHSVYPIEGLSPYQSNWTIRARVSQKSDIRTWSNQKGEGKLFNVNLMDHSGEIKATAFNNVVDDLYHRLEEGKVYYISKARVNLAKKKFSNLSNDYELTLERHTEIEEVRSGYLNRHFDLNTVVASALIPLMSQKYNSNSFPSLAWRN
jgi:replication factor A1